MCNQWYMMGFPVSHLHPIAWLSRRRRRHIIPSNVFITKSRSSSVISLTIVSDITLLLPSAIQRKLIEVRRFRQLRPDKIPLLPFGWTAPWRPQRWLNRYMRNWNHATNLSYHNPSELEVTTYMYSWSQWIHELLLSHSSGASIVRSP